MTKFIRRIVAVTAAALTVTAVTASAPAAAQPQAAVTSTVVGITELRPGDRLVSIAFPSDPACMSHAGTTWSLIGAAGAQVLRITGPFELGRRLPSGEFVQFGVQARSVLAQRPDGMYISTPVPVDCAAVATVAQAPQMG